MSISSITTNTSGRTQDLLIFQGLNPSSINTAQPVTCSFGTVSAYTTGIQKLVQRFAIVFLTQLTSQPDYPSFGTDFFTNLTGSTNPDGILLGHYFNFAILQAQQIFKNYQLVTTGLYPDEELARATLVDFAISGANLSLTIQITSLAGTSVQYILPFPLTN